MSFNRDLPMYSVNELLEAVRRNYEDKEIVWDFVSDFTGISIDTLYCMMQDLAKKNAQE